MSTKSTLRFGPNHHLYEECFDRGAVYLEMSHCEFSVESRCVSVRIPLEVWEHIRDVSPARFDLVGLNASELREHLKVLWHSRQTWVAPSRNPNLARMLGAAIWSGTTPAAQLAKSLRWHRREQRWQPQLLREIERLRQNKAGGRRPSRAATKHITKPPQQ